MGSFQTFGLLQLAEDRPAANVGNADKATIFNVMEYLVSDLKQKANKRKANQFLPIPISLMKVSFHLQICQIVANTDTG